MAWDTSKRKSLRVGESLRFPLSLRKTIGQRRFGVKPGVLELFLGLNLSDSPTLSGPDLAAEEAVTGLADSL
jgi:hypothetical protein